MLAEFIREKNGLCARALQELEYRLAPKIIRAMAPNIFGARRYSNSGGQKPMIIHKVPVLVLHVLVLFLLSSTIIEMASSCSRTTPLCLWNVVTLSQQVRIF